MKGGSPEGAAPGGARYVGDYGPHAGRGGYRVQSVPASVVGFVLPLVFGGAIGPEAGLAGLVATACGTVLGALGLFLSNVLFSGEEQISVLMDTWSALPAWVLIATGVCKAVATPLCLNLGWHGGHFFPGIFIGVTWGYGIAALTGADPVFCVVVTCGVFVAGVVKKPLLIVGLLLLCFPIEGIAWMVAAVYMGAYVPLPRALRG
jgi:H+/Cl- antiporter ClcA